MRRRAALVAATVLATMLIPVTNASAVDEVNTKKLRDAVTVSGIVKHERALQRIANNNGGTRASVPTDSRRRRRTSASSSPTPATG